MFSQTWKKYLPVIIILMKRSGNDEQVLAMNNSDFMRAAGGRKARLSFSNIKLNDGRINSMSDTPPVAMELLVLLKENELSKKIIRHQQFEFSLSSSFQLTIRNNTPVVSHDPSDNPTEAMEGKTAE